MDNQHTKISGYRDLTQEEIDLMNEIKAEGLRVQALVERISNLDVGDPEDPDVAAARRATAIARTELQTGFMWLTRAVALPGGF